MGEESLKKCLVVHRDHLFGKRNEHYFEGFMAYEKFIDTFTFAYQQHSFFLPRKTAGIIDAETDARYKQIIPLGIFQHENYFFKYCRLPGSGEQRLHARSDLGVGGHVEPEDIKTRSLSELEAALAREFSEELTYPDPYEIVPLGFVNEDIDSVGKVHFGVVYRIVGTTPNVSVRETDVLEGVLMPIADGDKIVPPFISWQKQMYEALRDVQCKELQRKK